MLKIINENLHLHVGAASDQIPSAHWRVPFPMSACPIGHEYEIVAPFV